MKIWNHKDIVDEALKLLEANPQIRQSDCADQLIKQGCQLSHRRLTDLFSMYLKGKFRSKTKAGEITPDFVVEEEKEEDILSRIKKDREESIKKGEVNKYKKWYYALLKEFDLSELRYTELLNIKEPVPIENITPLVDSGKDNEAVAIGLFSDWHLEEKVEKAMVNGVNEYNLEIAQKRSFKAFQSLLRLIKKERNEVNIDTLILWLGGDFITGYIHEELVEGNYLSPTEATRFAKKLLINGINFLLEHGGFKKVIIPCSAGNHGRTTMKLRISTGYKNSYEWMMYQDMRDYYENDKRVHFIIPESSIGYMEVFDKTIRFFHGDQIKFGGGIGGVDIPLRKWILRANQGRMAHMNFMGHFHDMNLGRDIARNGSLIGVSPYSQRFALGDNEPEQGFMLLDKKRGFTIKAPIFCT